MNDEVELTVPASPEYLRVARMMAAGVASRLGFTYEEVEDLRIAIDELCYAVTGRPVRAGTITLRYEIAGDRLTVQGRGRFEDELDEVPQLTPLSRQILAALSDEYELDAGHDGPTFRMVKVKREYRP